MKTAEKEKTEVKFKVGDKIKIIKESNTIHANHTGKVIEIRYEFINQMSPYRVKIDSDGNEFWIGPAEMDLVVEKDLSAATPTKEKKEKTKLLTIPEQKEKNNYRTTSGKKGCPNCIFKNRDGTCQNLIKPKETETTSGSMSKYGAVYNSNTCDLYQQRYNTPDKSGKHLFQDTDSERIEYFVPHKITIHLDLTEIAKDKWISGYFFRWNSMNKKEKTVEMSTKRTTCPSREKALSILVREVDYEVQQSVDIKNDKQIEECKKAVDWLISLSPAENILPPVGSGPVSENKGFKFGDKVCSLHGFSDESRVCENCNTDPFQGIITEIQPDNPVIQIECKCNNCGDKETKGTRFYFEERELRFPSPHEKSILETAYENREQAAIKNFTEELEKPDPIKHLLSKGVIRNLYSGNFDSHREKLNQVFTDYLIQKVGLAGPLELHRDPADDTVFNLKYCGITIQVGYLEQLHNMTSKNFNHIIEMITSINADIKNKIPENKNIQLVEAHLMMADTELEPIETKLPDNAPELLKAYEERIYNGVVGFYEAGKSFLAIKETKLYRLNYPTFDEYCKSRWDLSKTQVYNIIGASRVVDNLSTNGGQNFDKLPENERQARALSALLPKEQLKIWEEVLQETNNKPTAKDVQGKVDKFKGKDKPAAKQQKPDPPYYQKFDPTNLSGESQKDKDARKLEGTVQEQANLSLYDSGLENKKGVGQLNLSPVVPPELNKTIDVEIEEKPELISMHRDDLLKEINQFKDWFGLSDGALRNILGIIRYNQAGIK